MDVLTRGWREVGRGRVLRAAGESSTVSDRFVSLSRSGVKDSGNEEGLMQNGWNLRQKDPVSFCRSQGGEGSR